RSGAGCPPADEADGGAPALARDLHRLAPALGLRRRARASTLAAPRRAPLLPGRRDLALVAGLPGRAAPARLRRQGRLPRGRVLLRLAARAPALPARAADLPLLRARAAALARRRPARPAHRR